MGWTTKPSYIYIFRIVWYNDIVMTVSLYESGFVVQSQQCHVHHCCAVYIGFENDIAGRYGHLNSLVGSGVGTFLFAYGGDES